VQGILDELPTLEFRRLFGTIQLAHLIGPTVGLKDATFRELFPTWARPREGRTVPEPIRADLRVGLRLDMVSQALLDAIEE